MKVFLGIVGVLLAIIIFGLLLPDIVSGCSCQLEGGCQGCGGFIGNALGFFSLVCFALGVIGFALLIWYGIPLALLFLFCFGIYKLLKKGKSP